MSYKVFTINPGSTSTKIALYDGDQEVFSANVPHEAEKLAEYATISDQLPYREETILNELEKAHIDLSAVDAFSGRGGSLLSVEGGTYEINDILLEHATIAANGVHHPAQLGPQLCRKFAEKYGKRAFVVNPPDTDELQDVARMTGIKGLYRASHMHALNLKEMAIRHAEKMGEKYTEKNYITCHLGGGITVNAHRKGRMIDGNDIVGGDGPMTPTRCGSIPVAEVLNYMEKNHVTADEMRKLCTKTGGFVSHLGTNEGLDVVAMIEEGNKYAEMVWETMIYQIEKNIGSMAAVLKGDVDAILVGGGMAHNDGLVAEIKEAIGWIAPVYVYPGEFEMIALASGAIRVLEGKEEAKEYKGEPYWKGFDFEK